MIATTRYGFFVLLYFVQGIALAYFTGFQKRYLLGKGVEADRIALLTSLVLLPFILKPLIGLVADSFEIRRKLSIAVGLGTAAIAFFAVNYVDPSTHFFAFGFVMVCASLGVSIFDTNADALAVDAFDPSQFGALQSAMLVGKSAGLILFSLVFGMMIDRIGYSQVFFFLAAAMLVPFFLWKRVENRPRREHFQWSAFRALLKREVILIALFGVIYSIPSFGISGLFAYYFSHSGFEAFHVGSLEAAKSIGAVAGALGFAFLTKRMSLVRIAVVGTLLALFSSVVFPWNTSFMWVTAGVTLFGLAWALRETVYTTLAMKVTEASIAATMFSLLMAFSNLGTSLGEGITTAMAGRIGFANTFVFMGLLNLVSLIFFASKNLRRT